MKLSKVRPAPSQEFAIGEPVLIGAPVSTDQQPVVATAVASNKEEQMRIMLMQNAQL